MTGWTAIAGSGTVGPRGRIRVVLDGDEFVLWRSASGVPRLWGNRCPHRGMRLSFGLVRGEDLLCIYHGWRYGPTGRCAAIPAHPDLEPPATIAAEVRAVVERDGLLWTGDEGDPPDLAPLSAGRPFAFCRSIHVDRPADDVRRRLAAAPPPGWTASLRDDGLVVLAGPSAVAVAAVHAPDDGRSAVHVTVAADDPETRIALARRLAAFRDALEETP